MEAVAPVEDSDYTTTECRDILGAKLYRSALSIELSKLIEHINSSDGCGYDDSDFLIHCANPLLEIRGNWRPVSKMFFVDTPDEPPAIIPRYLFPGMRF